MWIWDHMTIHNGMEWLSIAIAKKSLVTVTDGSYICKPYPNLCLGAFFLEYAQGQGCIVDSFKKELAV
jgi:hypothetical protein